MADDLTLTVQPALGGAQTAYTGWTSVRVTRGIERCPADFEIEATSKLHVAGGDADIFPGDQCTVRLGADLVLTGYVDRVIPSLTAEEHTVRISGRSKCEDLVDCAAEFNTFEMIATDPVSLAKKVAAPFGISVDVIGDIGSTQIPQFDVIVTETAYEIIERVARYAALLAYDGPDGNLILTRDGSLSMQSGFVQGQNVQAATAFFTMDQRYSEVTAVLLSTDNLYTEPGDPNGSASALANDTIATANDPGVLRHRPLLLIAEQNDLNYQIAKQRAQWEVNRRFGRSQQVRITCDSWRDSAGELWQVNRLANVDLPALKIVNQVWLIGEVSYIKDERGTRADVTLMPKEAFQPEPIILAPYAAAVAQAVNQNGGAAGPNGVGGIISPPPVIPTGGAAP